MKRKPSSRAPHAHAASGGAYWMYGRHACVSALTNPARRVERAMMTRAAAEQMRELLGKTPCQIAEPRQFEQILPGDAVHQGVALRVLPLAPPDLQEVAAQGAPLVLLDQVSDPHNVGAILRSAAAFGAGAVIVHDRHAPGESGVMAKAASGALDMVPLVSVGNIANALEELGTMGYWSVGLDGEATQPLGSLKLEARTVLVMGAEGRGLRHLTAQRCDMLACLPMHPRMESLNVSNAAAIALYVLASSR